uniref:Uncharacterized protein n=1 Tax=Zea mays TaxID=4577 RepID=A0A804RG21_MAIZE
MDLPADVKERELHNLLCWLLGFETSEMNFKGNQPMGFALFSTVHQAITAKAMFQDTVFDAETKVALQTDMAKKNLFVKRSNWLDLVKGGFIANVQCAEDVDDAGAERGHPKVHVGGGEDKGHK